MRVRWLFLLCLLFVFSVNPWVPQVAGGNLGQDGQLIWVGTGAFRDGLYDIAEKEFLQFVKDYPTHGKVYDVCYLLGKTLLARGKLKEAESIFSKIIAEHKSFEETDYTLFWLAQVEIRLGNPEEAKRILLILTKRFPKFEWTDYANTLLGLLDFSVNRLTPAESYFKLVTSSSKRQELIRSSFFWLGILSYRKKEFEAAIRHFQSFGNDPKGVPEGYVQNALLWISEAEVKASRFLEARNSFRMYYDQFKQDPLIPAVHWRLGFCEYRLGNTLQAFELFHAFENQYQESKFLAYTHYLLGEIYLSQNDFASSIREFNSVLSAVQVQPLWGAALISEYWSYFHLGSFDEANKVIQRLAKLNLFEEERAFLQWLDAEIAFSEGRVSDFLPYYFQIINTRFRERALFQIGRGYFYEGQFRDAITNLDILSLEFPNSKYRDEGLFVRGESYLQLGNADQALEAFALISRKGGTFPWDLLALAEIGSIYLHRNDYDQAEKAFRTITQEFPDHPLYYYAAFQLGNVQFKKTNIAEAISLYSLVLKGNAFDLLGEVYFRFGEIFYRQAKYESALSSFQTAMRYFEENSISFFLTQLEIGNLQRRSDRVDEAKRSYQNILDHSNDQDIRNAAHELLMGIKPQ